MKIIKKNCVIELCITNVNDKDGISVYIDVPVKDKNSLDKLVKMLDPKENDKFFVNSGSINVFEINVLQYFKKRSTIDEILERIQKLENDILTVTKSNNKVVFEYIEDVIDIRAVSEELVNLDVNKYYIKDLLNYDYGDVIFYAIPNNIPIEIAIDLMDNKQLVNFLVTWVAKGGIKAYKVLDMLLKIKSANDYEYIAGLISHLPSYNFQNLKCIYEKN